MSARIRRAAKLAKATYSAEAWPEIELERGGRRAQRRAGHRLTATVFGSSTQSVVGGASTSYVLARGGGLLEASLGVTGRLEEGEWVDRLLSGVLRGATPFFSGLRVVARVGLDARANDTSKALVALGGNNGLRGYASQSLVGYGASALVGFTFTSIFLSITCSPP